MEVKMFFDLKHLTDQERTTGNIQLTEWKGQSIIAAFNNSQPLARPGKIGRDSKGQYGLYRFEELLNHSELYMEEMRGENASAEWQAVCDTFHRERMQKPTKEELIIGMLAEDMKPEYPNAAIDGFNLGVFLLPHDEDSCLNEGGTLHLNLFPRNVSWKNKNVRDWEPPDSWPSRIWPFDPGRCEVVFPIGEEDSGPFWGLIGTALRIAMPIDTNGQSAQARRREFLSAFLSETPKQMHIVPVAAKYCFLNHVLNVLVGHVNEKFAGRRSVGVVQAAEEYEIRTEADKVTSVRPTPFLQVIK